MSATATAIQAIARRTPRRFRTRTSPGTMRGRGGRWRGSVNDVDGRDIVALGILVMQAGDGFLHRVGRVVLAPEDAVLLGRRVGAVGEGLVGVVLIRALPLDPLTLVQHDRVVAVLLEGGLIEALVLVEELAASAVGVDPVRVELVAPEVVVAVDPDDLQLARLVAVAGDHATAGGRRLAVGRDDHRPIDRKSTR